MTREEAIQRLENMKKRSVRLKNSALKRGYSEYAVEEEALNLAIKSLRPITREQVEKMRGEWEIGSDTLGTLISCSECDRGFYVADKYEYQRCIHQQFCELCGAPMTDKAVDILWKRLEALKDAGD